MFFFFIMNEGIKINTRTWSTVRAIGIDSNIVELFIVGSLLSVRFSGFNTELLMFRLFYGEQTELACFVKNGKLLETCIHRRHCMSNLAKPANLPKNPSQMPREYPLYMLVACFICLMINTYHFYLNSAFNCKQNKDIFRVCYMTSRAIDLVAESARIEKRTVVESLAKFIVLASEISRIIVEAAKVLENIVLCSSESSRELS